MKYFFPIILVALLLSCKKQQAPEEHCFIHPIPYADLASLFFKTNSYWVYLDSVPLTYDSAYVVSDMTTKICGKSPINHFTIKHSPAATLETVDVHVDGCFINYTKIYDAFRSIEHEPTKYTRTFYDSLFIFDRYYKNVEKTIVNGDQNESNNKSVYYMNSDLGILRKDIYDTGNNLLSRKLLVKKSVIK